MLRLKTKYPSKLDLEAAEEQEIGDLMEQRRRS